MIDTKELRQLAQAVSGWSNCNQAWLDQWEDPPAAVVGHINEDGETYPVATIDCDQYYAAHESLQLAQFYAAANPATIIELLDRLEAVERERDALRARIEAMEQQVPICRAEDLRHAEILLPSLGLMPEDKLYALPGAQELNLADPAVQKRLATQWGYVPADAHPAPIALVGARKVTRDFRWDSVTQCHVPMLKVEFEPIPVDAPSDAKGWRDQARIAVMLDDALAAAPEAKP